MTDATLPSEDDPALMAQLQAVADQYGAAPKSPLFQGAGPAVVDLPLVVDLQELDANQRALVLTHILTSTAKPTK